MKKYLLSFALLLLLGTQTQGQTSVYYPFPDSNAVWSERDVGQGICSGICDYQYKMIGDTMIDSVQYHKIYEQDDSLPNFDSSDVSYYGAIREQAKKIYFRIPNCNQEFSLYDFTKHVGDTLERLYISISYPSCDTTDYWAAVITSIDSILIDGNYRKVFNFGDSLTEWIEGIGSINGLFNAIDPASVLGNISSFDLVCFRQNDSLKYLNPNYSDCFPVITGIEEIVTNNNSFTISPNPATDQLTIHTSSFQNEAVTVAIMNVLGQTTSPPTPLQVERGEALIDVSGLSAGMYFLELKGESGSVVGRFVKE